MNKKDEVKKKFERDGVERKCHYCGIDEDKFLEIWDYFYPRKLPDGSVTGRSKLEIDRKDNKKEHLPENCVLACSICNNAKSDKFTYKEFKMVGKVIKQIWNERES